MNSNNHITLILSSLVFLIGSLAQAQVTSDYNIRPNPTMGTATLVGWTDSSCELTGANPLTVGSANQFPDRENFRQVQCGSRRGWVHIEGINPNYRAIGTRTIEGPSTQTPQSSARRQPIGDGSSFFTELPTTEVVGGVSPQQRPQAARQADIGQRAQPANQTPQYPQPSGVEGTVRGYRNFIEQLAPSRVNEVRTLRARQGDRGRVNLFAVPEVMRPPERGGSPFCGAYTPERVLNEGRGQLYFTPTAGCLMTGVAQEWRRRHCPDNGPDCRLVVGDGSHGEQIPRSWPHNNHRAGACLDVYLPRRAGAGLTDQAGNQGTWDREKTRALISLMREFGASPNIRQGGATPGSGVVFDRGLGGIHVGGHGNHIHVCFGGPEHHSRYASNARRCDQIEFDTRICPELAGALPHQQQPTQQGGDGVNTVTAR
jgi:hypothetical protein